MGFRPKCIAAWFGMIALPSCASATDATAGYVQSLILQQEGAAFFSLSTQPSSGWASCAAAQRIVVNLATPGGQALYSALPTAQKSHAQLEVHGKGTCNITGDFESVAYLVVH